MNALWEGGLSRVSSTFFLTSGFLFYKKEFYKTISDLSSMQQAGKPGWTCSLWRQDRGNQINHLVSTTLL